jgi:predicted metalloprotease with PDZ domain
MFQANPEKTIELCSNQILDLEKDLEKSEGIFSEKTIELIKQEINSNKIKIKEAELQIRYTDYQ